MKPNGVHHMAICTANIKKQIEFFTDVMGMELVSLYWMHGAKDAWHAFLKLNDQSFVAFVQMPAITRLPIEYGKTHAGSGTGASAPGTLQHVAFNVDTRDDLLAMRDRIRSRGVHVLGMVDHGTGKSIYFAGPEGLALEVSMTEGQTLSPETEIDDEVVGLAGISPEELARFQSPAHFARTSTPVPQPPMNSGQPEMFFPVRAEYEKLMTLPDEVVWGMFREADRPAKAKAERASALVAD